MSAAARHLRAAGPDDVERERVLAHLDACRAALRSPRRRPMPEPDEAPTLRLVSD